MVFGEHPRADFAHSFDSLRSAATDSEMAIAKASSLVEHSGQRLRNLSFRNSGHETNNLFESGGNGYPSQSSVQFKLGRKPLVISKGLQL